MTPPPPRSYISIPCRCINWP